MRGRVAPARQPPCAAAGAHQVGVAYAEPPTAAVSVLVVGGAGFIGSHFVDRLARRPRLTDGSPCTTTSAPAASGTCEPIGDDPRLERRRGRRQGPRALTAAMDGHDTVIHLASNPDIAAAMTDPAIDFHEGTLLTHHVVEAMRRHGARASSTPRAAGSTATSASRGGRGPRTARPDLDVRGDQARRRGADLRLRPHVRVTDSAFRFGNVVGPRQTHGVGFDFLRRLLEDPTRADDPRRRQAEQVVHPRRRRRRRPFSPLTGQTRTRSASTTSRRATTSPCTEIAELAIECSGSTATTCAFEYTGGIAAGRVTCRSCASTPSESGPSAGVLQLVAGGALRVDGALLAEANAGGSEAERRAVFLDRDGVLNAAVVREGAHPPARREESRTARGRGRLHPSPRGRLRPHRGHQPARHRPPHAGRLRPYGS